MRPETGPARIALVTDAWEPQMNGVVRTLSTTVAILRGWGHEVLVISPDGYRSLPCPTYSEIRLAMASRFGVGRRLEAFAPDAVHIATEGPLGLAARRHCLARGQAFTTAYHTQFPDYLARRTHLPAATFWPYIRRFHRPSAGIMVATESVGRTLRDQGLPQLRSWSRGVDLAQFSPDIPAPELFAELPRPIQLYVGRVSAEKNIAAFLESRHPGAKVVVGDGPALDGLRARYPEAHFVGRKSGRELAAYYAGADVFVFPSRTDTFGLVMIEALACGTPVAGYPVTGPVDILTPAAGAMDDDLNTAIAAALACDQADCVALGRSYSWESSARQFLAALVDGPQQACTAA
ncbi:MAG: glycosyltransferase family 1 protein [Sphingomonadaceae bacterium]